MRMKTLVEGGPWQIRQEWNKPQTWFHKILFCIGLRFFEVTFKIESQSSSVDDFVKRNLLSLWKPHVNCNINLN